LPLIGYCVLIGTNEEQFFNFLLAPALICLIVVVWNSWARIGRALRAVAVVGAAAVLLSDCINYAVIHANSDDGTRQVDAWMASHVPIHTVVAVTNSVQREIFTRYTMVNDASGATLGADVRYLVVFYRQVDENYAFVDRSTIDRQVRSLRLVFNTSDRSNGRMAVYEVA
jgi:hypothetical protein